LRDAILFLIFSYHFAFFACGFGRTFTIPLPLTVFLESICISGHRQFCILTVIGMFYYVGLFFLRPRILSLGFRHPKSPQLAQDLLCQWLCVGETQRAVLPISKRDYPLQTPDASFFQVFILYLGLKIYNSALWRIYELVI
jgi:hypothetical protein